MHTILGINGATGPYLARALRQRNLPVRGVSRRTFLGDDWTHQQADVTNPADALAAVDGAETVYLLVGIEYNRDIWRRTWPVIMENTIRACEAHGAKLVFMDNVYPYGLVHGPMTESTPMNPVSEKGKIRMAVDQMLLSAMDKGLRGCIARGADFYGPNCSTSVLNLMLLERYAAGKKGMLMGRADKVHTYSYVPDLGQALAILGTDARADGQVWHLPSSPEPWTGADWAKAAAAAFGMPPKYTTIPTWVLHGMGLFSTLMREMAEMNYQFSHDYVFSSEKFERTFGLKPTPYAQGLAETVAFYRNKQA